MHMRVLNTNNIIILQIIDARPKGMFDGTAPDPNPKLHSGHILGSINFPFTTVIDTENKKLKDVENLKQCKENLLCSSI